MKLLVSVLLTSLGTVSVAAAADGREQLAAADNLTNEKNYRARGKLESVLVQARQERGAVSLEAVALTGSRLEIPTRDLPASIATVPQELIQLRGARTANEALYAAVGMTGGMGSGSIPSFSTRGFTGNDITIMRDGIRQNTSSQSSRPLDSFLFERIEVLKGPASLLYGEGAVGGAINYVSKQPSDTFSGEANISAGSWDSYRASFGAGGPTARDDVFFRADISTNRSGGYVDDSASNYSAYAGALRWDITPATSATLSATYLRDRTDSYYGTPVVYDAVIDQHGVRSVRKANTATDTLVNARIASGTRRLNYNNRDNFAEAENAFYRLIVDSELAEHWSLRNETYIATQHMNWRNTENTIWNPVTQRVDRSSFFLIYRKDYQIGNRLDLSWDDELFGLPNKFVLGALYDSNNQLRNSGQTYAASPTPASVPLTGFDRGYGPDVSYQKTAKIITDTAAIYFEDILEPIGGLKVVSGLRYDSIDIERKSYVGIDTYKKSYYPTTGRIGLIYAVAPQTNIYASYSRAAQPVSQLVSLSAAQDDFSLQKGRQYEIGAKSTLFAGRADLTLALFDIEKTDLLTTEVVNNVRVNSQVGAQVSQGAEFALALALDESLHIDTHIAWTWGAEFEEFYENLGSVGAIDRSGKTPPNVPKVVAGFFVAKDIGAWTATGGVRYVGEREANNNNGIQLDAYTTWDASLGYRWQRIGLTLWGRNLTDKRYAELAAGSGLMQRLADPRSFDLTLKYTF
jgi:iron complex outermembrane recepter protein